MRTETKPNVLSLAAMALLGACARVDSSAPLPQTRVLTCEEALEAEILVARQRCAACHASESSRVTPEPAPSLETIGARRTPEGLRRWLDDPHAVKPGTAMPDLLAKLDKQERERALDELVHYLAAQGGPLVQVERQAELSELELGRRLYHEVGCVACHAPQEDAEDLARPLMSFPADERIAPQVSADLGNPAFDTEVEPLAKFLEAPLAVRPSGRMPSLALESEEARALATYLLRGRIGEEGLVETPGWRWRYYEGNFQHATPGFDGAKVVAEGRLESLDELPPHRPDHFGFEYSGQIHVEETGTYTFWTRSDDGSVLHVDGRKVVDNDGDHAPQERSGEVRLEAGSHEITVAFYENAGGEELSLHWKRPGGEKEPLPQRFLSHGSARMRGGAAFKLDARKVASGRERFAELGCAACHTIEGRGIAAPKEQELAEIAGKIGSGCLADDGRGSAPRLALDERERTLVRSWLTIPNVLERPRSDNEELDATLARLDCRACHRRDGVGGPDAQRARYFRETVEADLGNEGRLPPLLEGVGRKLHEDWMARVLLDGARVRPYVAARMPLYGTTNVASLPKLFASVDAPEASATSPFDPDLVEAGRKLAGKKGLGCIQCHRFNGVESLGIPAVDLATVRERVRGPWFRQLLSDPKSLGLNTRMPEMWQRVDTANGMSLRSPVADVLDGDPQRQIDALWQYLSLGVAMPLPDGLLVPEREYELVLAGEPELCAVFLRGHTPRGLMVGLPEQVHYAWDFEHSRAVWMWRGRFFNAGGTWNGRAGGLERPPTNDAYEFPAGGALESDTKLAPKALGWKLDAAKRPVFRYALGGATVEETLQPKLTAEGALLVRSVVVRSPASGPAPVLRVAATQEQLEFQREGVELVARADWEVKP
ncbi:MAG: c-type cytochrome [Planctomycetaceae bacterium]|nr:c-type cytochrome [Planctomycetaceae bacterium]